MNVLFIDWVSIPKDTHLDILKNISIGEHIASLPYNTNDYPSWKIPIPTPVAMVREDPGIIEDIEYIEFEKHRVIEYGDELTSMYVWERIH